MVQLQVTILNVALARIGDVSGTGVRALQWFMDSCAIAFATLRLSSGRLGNGAGPTGFIPGVRLYQ